MFGILYPIGDIFCKWWMKEKKKKVTFTIQGWGFCHESCKTDLAGHSATLRKVGPFNNGYCQRANAVKCNKKKLDVLKF